MIKINAAARLKATTETHIAFKDKHGHEYKILNRNNRPINFAVVGYYPHHPKTAFSAEVPAKWDVVAAGKTSEEMAKVVKHHVKQFGVTQLEIIDLPA